MFPESCPMVCCKRLKWFVKPTVITIRTMNIALRTRLNVPPNPAAILAGEDSRKFGMLAPIPTAIPERPPQRARQHIRWTKIALQGNPSMESLRRISPRHGIRPPTNEKRNFDHTI